MTRLFLKFKGAMYRQILGADEPTHDEEEFFYRYTDQNEIGIMSDKYYTKEFIHVAHNKLGWLPKPPFRYQEHASYFTERGNEKFVERALLTFEHHIPVIVVKRYTKAEVGEVVYSDKYQVIAES